MHELHKYRLEKDHQMRNGHLSEEDKNNKAYHRYGFLDSEDKQYHSPEHPETLEHEDKMES